jgi:hypothetical protein
MPTPTVVPSSGPTDGVERVAGATVVKLLLSVTSASSALAAVAVTV